MTGWGWDCSFKAHSGNGRTSHQFFFCTSARLTYEFNRRELGSSLKEAPQRLLCGKPTWYLFLFLLMKNKTKNTPVKILTICWCKGQKSDSVHLFEYDFILNHWSAAQSLKQSTGCWQIKPRQYGHFHSFSLCVNGTFLDTWSELHLNTGGLYKHDPWPFTRATAWQVRPRPITGCCVSSPVVKIMNGRRTDKQWKQSGIWQEGRGGGVTPPHTHCTGAPDHCGGGGGNERSAPTASSSSHASTLVQHGGIPSLPREENHKEMATNVRLAFWWCEVNQVVTTSVTCIKIDPLVQHIPWPQLSSLSLLC